jgi:hypothetical protein
MVKSIIFVTLSDNYDHQEVAFSMFNALYGKYKVYNIGLKDQKNPRSPKTKNSFYFNAPKRPGINLQTFNIIELLKIIQKINRLKVDIVYFESEHLWNILIMRLLSKRIEKISAIHDVIPHEDSKGKKLANKYICKYSDKIVVRNKTYINDLSKIYSIPKDKIIFLPLWRYYPPKNISSKNHDFLFFGRIRKYKGIDNMLKIAKLCPKTKFKVVGSPDRASITVVEELKKLKNVTVVDYEVSDIEMESFFTQSKAIILPYESATQSGVIVDAYKYSRPVIAFNVGAISEQVRDGESGYLVEAKNINAFISAINKLDKLPKTQIEKMQKKAYDFGFHKYSAQENSINFIETIMK